MKGIFLFGVLAPTIMMSLGGCATPGKIPNTWRSESYLRDHTVDSQQVESTLVSILGEFAAESSAFAKPNEISDAYRQTRNAAQDYLKAVSVQNCGTFKTASLATQSNTNFQFGAISTVLGVAGGLLSPESTAQALSASSTGVNTLKTQYGQDFYREKTFEILTRAMDVKRKTVWANIVASRSRDLDDEQHYDYTINQAIADVIEYNNACSVISGFEELADSIDAKEEQVDQATLAQKTGQEGDANILSSQNLTTSNDSGGRSNVNMSILTVDEILSSR